MPKISDPEHLKARATLIGEEADRWIKHHGDSFATLAVGTTVIIDITTGDYVTGTTWHQAHDAFKQRFGAASRLSHSFTVGRPIFVGGGVWLK